MPRRSLQAYYAFTVLSSLRFTDGLWILYLLHCHWTLWQVGLAESGFHLVSFLSDLPTGIFADTVGPRRSLAAGLAIGAATTVSTFLTAPHHIIWAMVSISLGSLGWTFIGGADQALLFHIGQEACEDSYQRLYGRTVAMALLSTAAGVAAGGWLAATVGWAIPYVLTAVFKLLALASVIKLPPGPSLPPKGQPAGRHTPVLALRQALASPRLVLLIAFGSVVGITATINNLYAQSTLTVEGGRLAAVSAVIAASYLTEAAGAWLSSRSRLGSPSFRLRLATAALGAGILATGTVPFWAASPSFLLSSQADGYMEPLYESALNAKIPDALRATLLSLPGTGFSLGMMILFPVAGWALSHHRRGLVYCILAAATLAMALSFPGGTDRADREVE